MVSYPSNRIALAVLITLKLFETTHYCNKNNCSEFSMHLLCLTNNFYVNNFLQFLHYSSVFVFQLESVKAFFIYSHLVTYSLIYAFSIIYAD